jgi:hypothetical protein
METSKVLMVVAVFAVLVAAGNMIVTFSKVAETKAKIAGFASSEIGNATLYVQGVASINFTTNLINWSNGSITNGFTYAYLHTNYTDGNPSTYSSGSGTGGSLWLNVTSGLVIENNGNSKVNLTLNASNNANGFICNDVAGTGPCATNVPAPVYAWNIVAHQGSPCLSPYTLQDSANYVNVNGGGGPARVICQNFTDDDLNDAIRVDLQLGLPLNTPPGSKLSVITAIATAL